MQVLSPIVRPATDADAVAIADLSRVTFEESFAPFNTREDMDKFMNERFSRTQLVAEVYDRLNSFFVAEMNGVLCGYLKLRESEPPAALNGAPSLELARIYTAKGYIGTGIGKQLMQTAIDVAQSRQKEILWLGVWEHNERAIGFYHRWGFERFGQHEFILGNDVQTDWLMKKQLKQ